MSANEKKQQIKFGEMNKKKLYLQSNQYIKQ